MTTENLLYNSICPFVHASLLMVVVILVYATNSPFYSHDSYLLFSPGKAQWAIDLFVSPIIINKITPLHPYRQKLNEITYMYV